MTNASPAAESPQRRADSCRAATAARSDTRPEPKALLPRLARTHPRSQRSPMRPSIGPPRCRTPSCSSPTPPDVVAHALCVTLVRVDQLLNHVTNTD